MHYGRTDGRTDRPSYRDARTHLKREKRITCTKLIPRDFYQFQIFSLILRLLAFFHLSSFISQATCKSVNQPLSQSVSQLVNQSVSQSIFAIAQEKMPEERKDVIGQVTITK